MGASTNAGRGASIDAAIGGASTDAAIDGSSTDAAICGSSTDAAIGGSSTDAAIDGISTGAAICGSSMDAAICGSSMDAAIGGSSTDAAIDGATGARRGSAAATGWIGTQYVRNSWFSLIAPALVGMAVAWAASAASGGNIVPRVLTTVVASVAAVLSAALAFRVYAAGGLSPLHPAGRVLPPYVAAVGGVLAWPLLFAPPRRDDADESIGAFITRRFGREATTYLAEPLLAGIHAGHVDRLSIRALLPRLVDAQHGYGSSVAAVTPSITAAAVTCSMSAWKFRMTRWLSAGMTT